MERFYTDGEIRTAYRQAKNKKEQLRILADLNCCTIADIQRILNPKEDETMRRKHDWDAILGELGNAPTADAIRAATQKHGVTPAQIRNSIGNRRAKTQSPASAPITFPVPAAESNELARIRTLLDWARPDDSADVKEHVRDIVSALAVQMAERVQNAE